MKLANLKNKVLFVSAAVAASPLACFADAASIDATIADGTDKLSALVVSVATIGAASLSIVIAVKTWKVVKHAFSAA